MPFRAGGENDYPDRIPAEAETYRLRIDSYMMALTKPNRYEEGGREQIRFLLSFEAIHEDEDAQILDIKGNPLDADRRVMFFFDPERMGLKPVVAKSRKFLASALGVEVSTPVEYPDLKALAEDLVGRELIADVAVDGQYNEITDTRPIRQKRERPRRAASLVEEAERVFASEEPTDDDY